MTTVEKIKVLRRLMKARGMAALIVPATDPHQSEYVEPHWQARQWVSGFTGSAGTLVITLRDAGLWTDGRYFLQAARELKGSSITLFKSRQPGVPTVHQWVAGQLRAGQTVAFDGRLFSMEAVKEMQKAFADKSLRIKADEDLVGSLWHDRPALSRTPAFDYPVHYAGRSRRSKLADVRNELKAKGADGLLLASLDDIAWLLNIRGNEGGHSPVVSCYALIGRNRADLFLDSDRIPGELVRKLARIGVVCRPYAEAGATLQALAGFKSLLLNPRKINHALAEALPDSLRLIEETTDITTRLKAVKNPVEQAHFHHAALLDGVALVKFHAWLDRSLAAGGKVTEYEAAVRLSAFRKEAPEYRGDSFASICGYGANAAMIHYSAKPDNAVPLRRRGLFLVDSGGQYFEGTMDTTRTLALGPVSGAARRDYTLVLKGLIALSRIHFPTGVTGTHLDALVRAPLWGYGVNFNHGSGHGVGTYLNVHEGPHGLASVWNPTVLTPGMVMTIEPGVYVAGRYGIRIENMVLVKEAETTEHGTFLKFETLTVCPIDTAPLVVEWLTPDERVWLNTYHRTVWKQLSTHVTGEVKRWLRQKTADVLISRPSGSDA